MKKSLKEDMAIAEVDNKMFNGADGFYCQPFLKEVVMYNKDAGSYDEIPEAMKAYINNYGCHFNKKLCEEAVSRMYTKVNGKREYIQPYTKDQILQLLQSYGISLEHNKLYDAVYVANMAKADFLGKSVPSEKHLALYIKDVVDDADAAEGYIFNRFYADSIFMNNPIEWEDML